jgi:hypothetical protein
VHAEPSACEDDAVDRHARPAHPVRSA